MTGGKTDRRALLLGLVSSVLFSVTYVVNNAMAQSGGHWMWGACLRFLLMLPALLALAPFCGGLGPVLRELRVAPGRWLLWSVVGFGLFYAPLTFASAYGPSWLVAGTFQFTILAGALMTPLLTRTADGGRGKIPVRLFPAFGVILLGVFALQWENARDSGGLRALVFVVPVLVSAFAYPLGNRKTMALCGGRLGTVQRVLAMTLGSLPLWILMAGAACLTAGPPSGAQVLQSAIVAFFSGLLATLVFFSATRMVRAKPQALALVESTQCGEVAFSLLGGVWLLGNPLPGLLGWVGLGLIVGGMLYNSLLQPQSH